MAVDPTTWRMVKDASRAGSSREGRSYDCVWKIRCTSPTDTVASVLAWRGCPSLGSIPPREVGLGGFYRYADSQVVPMGDSPHWFEVRATFAIGSSIAPLSKWSVRGGGVETTVPYWFDLDGNAFANSAGQLMLPLPEGPAGEQQFTLTVRRLKLDAFRNASRCVNSDSIWGYPALTLRTGPVAYRSASEDGFRFWEIDVPIHYKPDDWRLTLVDAGWNYLDAGELKGVAEHPAYATTELSVPPYLDGSGGVLPIGGTPVEGEFRLYREISFAAIDLPDPFKLPPP